jgi:transcriptional regulator with XRE-family HTH domain
VNTFSYLLRDTRQHIGLSQNQLAERAGIDGTYISKIERGGPVRPTREKVLAIADALKITDKAKRAYFLLAAGTASLEDLEGLAIRKEYFSEVSASSTFGSPISLGEDDDDEEQQQPTLEAQVQQILAEAYLPYKDRQKAERMILEMTQAICRMLKEEKER